MPEQNPDSKKLCLRIEQGRTTRVIDLADGREITNIAAEKPPSWEAGRAGALITLTLIVRESEVEGRWELTEDD